MAKLERIYTVPLRKGFVESARHRRTKKALCVLKTFLKKHFKAEDVKIGEKLNAKMWEKGAKNPPGKVTITGFKEDDNIVKVELKGHKYVDKTKKEEVKKEGIAAKLQEKLGGMAPKKKRSKKADKEEAVEEKKEEKKEVAEKKAETPKKESKPVEKPKEVAEKPVKDQPKKAETPKTDKNKPTSSPSQ